ncbi:MAG TPA: hypothetical protein VMV69_02550 [Pirellulales bacterium]|nr:hypothetical protein [Pirellulales bacterium]
MATSNHRLGAAKAFTRWLVRDRRAPDNALAHLSAMNAKVDVRRERRTLDPAEFVALIEAARRGEAFRELSGPDRALLYMLAANTGLRANELASLTRASFNLEGDPPTVTVEAGYSKRRRRDVLPLRADLVVRLCPFLSTFDLKAPGLPQNRRKAKVDPHKGRRRRRRRDGGAAVAWHVGGTGGRHVAGRFGSGADEVAGGGQRRRGRAGAAGAIGMVDRRRL